MKKNLLVSCIAFFLLSAASASYAAIDVVIALTGNAGYVPNGSMDDAVSWYGDDAAWDLNVYNFTDSFEGETSGAWYAAGADFEPRIFYNAFGLGLSAGYQYGGKTASKASSEDYTSVQSLAMTLTAFSYLGTFYYSFNINKNSSIVLGLGGGYYQAAITRVEKAEGFATGNFKTTTEYTGSTFGAHLKVEYNRRSGKLNYFFGIMGRYANVDEFEGDDGSLVFQNENVEGSFTGAFAYAGIGVIF